jgi:hypothetical protein
VKIVIAKLIFAAAVLAAALCLGIAASQAGQIGNEKWCAVADQGGGAVIWDCEFETVDDCSPAILAGNRGFCALNPGYRQPEPPTDPQR